MDSDLYVVVLMPPHDPYGAYSREPKPEAKKVYGPASHSDCERFIRYQEWGRDLGGYHPAYAIRKAKITW